MAEQRVYNFSAGPSMLPLEALERAGAEMTNYRGSGMSVMEMSHRSKTFDQIFIDTKRKIRTALSVPDGYEILFLQGGASSQFAMVPLNLMGRTGRADYAVTGNFSSIAFKEAKKYGEVGLSASSADRNHTYIPTQEDLVLDPGAGYFHYCANNTIYGTAWDYVPRTDAPLVCDMSSEIMSHPVDVSRYGLIYAGAQKNMAPAGLTVVIVGKELAGRELPITPQIMSYAKMIDTGSMLNTPPAWCIYMLGLTLAWVEEQGGVTEMERRKKERSALLYDVLCNSRFYRPHAEEHSRSDMNVTFRTPGEELDREFVKGASARGLLNVKGHRLTGGIRASLYNAMPLAGARALADYMKEFEGSHV